MVITKQYIRALRLQQRIKKKISPYFIKEKQVFVDDMVATYKKIWEEAALRLDARIVDMSEDIWELRKDNKSVRLNNYKVPLDNPVILSIAGNKLLCYELLKKARIPIPEHTSFTINEIHRALRFFKEKEGPFVVKPSFGTSGGRGITTGIKSIAECISAIALASLYDNRMIIEKMHFGESYRLLLLNNEVIHAVRRTGVRVMGDGISSLKNLIEKNYENTDGARINIVKRLENDDDLNETIKAQDLAFNMIPEMGRSILVKSLPENTAGNPEANVQYNEDITKKICKSIIDTAQSAVRHLGICFAGVDLITCDPLIPLEDSGGAVIEINSTPGLHHHYKNIISSGSCGPAETVIKYLLQC